MESNTSLESMTAELLKKCRPEPDSRHKLTQ
jgi:hypothetical protein